MEIEWDELWACLDDLPSGKRLHFVTIWNDSPFFMGKSTISMVIFNCYVSLPEGSIL